MKVEFNGNNFSADMGNTPSSAPLHLEQLPWNMHLAFIFGCLALMTAIAQGGIGVLVRAVAELLIYTIGFTGLNYLIFSLIAYITIALICVTFGVISIVYSCKAKPMAAFDTTGLVFSIISFVVCGLSLALNLFLTVPIFLLTA